MAEETKEACLCDHESIVCGRFFGGERQMLSKASGGPKGGMDIQQEEGDVGRGHRKREGPGTAFGGGERNRPHAGWPGVDKPKNGNGGHG